MNNNNNQKDEKVQLRLSFSEKQILARHAAKFGVSMSRVIRQKIHELEAEMQAHLPVIAGGGQ